MIFFSSPLHAARTHLQGSSLTKRNTYSFHSKLLWFDIYFKRLRCINFLSLVAPNLSPDTFISMYYIQNCKPKCCLFQSTAQVHFSNKPSHKKITHLLGFRSWRSVQIQDKGYLETFWLWNLLICGNSAYLYDFIHHLKSLQKSK